MHDIDQPENDYIKRQADRQKSSTVAGNGPWISDGDCWRCDYCNSIPYKVNPLPKSCSFCGSDCIGGHAPSDPTAGAANMSLMSLITARGD